MIESSHPLSKAVSAPHCLILTLFFRVNVPISSSLKSVTTANCHPSIPTPPPIIRGDSEIFTTYLFSTVHSTVLEYHLVRIFSSNDGKLLNEQKLPNSCFSWYLSCTLWLGHTGGILHATFLAQPSFAQVSLTLIF